MEFVQNARNLIIMLFIIVLFCRQTEVVRESWWSWIQDHLPMTICRIFHNLDDQSFIRALLGDYSVRLTD